MREFMNYEFVVTDIIHACHVPAGTGEAVHRNRPAHGLAYMTDNSKIYNFENGLSLCAEKNSIIYLPKASSYVVETPGPGACYAINFEVADICISEPFVFSPQNTADMISSFSRAERCWAEKDFGYRSKCICELYNIIYIMQHEYFSLHTGKSKAGIIAPAVEYIQKNYTSELLNISELSDMCAITPEYFRSIFRKCYGTSPKKHINNLKMTRAAELISSGMFTVKDAAEMSGFSDISHFSREFKKAYGVPPTALRKK
ncbi:MAG: helix-turn-helix transcriptional regulator [Clostridia bacterium]|nr:helix-turn-helix transcriptional regulator [Clostridia bacterium]